MRRLTSLGLAIAFTILLTAPARAELVSLDVTSREPFAEGKPIGDVGPCERLRGTIRFELDPKLKANQIVVDLELCPTSTAGRVEFSSDFDIVLPVDRSKCNGALFYEVNNRGNRTAPNTFDGGADYFLLRQGFIVAWSGWIAEMHPGNDRLTMTVPIPRQNGEPLRGIVRQEVIVDKPAARSSVMHRPNIGAYRPNPAKLSQATLTQRVREADAREPVPRNQWKLVITEVDRGHLEYAGKNHPLPMIELEVAGGLKPGVIYEIIYEAEGSIVQGVGFAGIRDFVSFLKHDATEKNPLRTPAGKPLVTRTLGFGTSQSGRALRSFLYDGFNADEQGRRAFDGVMPHVAGGGLGSFNHRFCSPTRTNGQHEEHEYEVDVFPFAYGGSSDVWLDHYFSNENYDGIFVKAGRDSVVPKLMHTQSSSEYWHRSGSLVHTLAREWRDDPLDMDIPKDVRIYTFGGTRHSTGSGVADPQTLAGLPGYRDGGQLPPNPADYRPLMRALILALDAWVRDDRAPPPSSYPKIADNTLDGWTQRESGWRVLPGVEYPKVIQQPSVHDRLARRDKTQSTIKPRTVNRKYTVLVPAYGLDGNEVGCLNLPTLSVPVATYTSWNLRNATIGAEGELLGLQGGYIPFAKTAADRAAKKDPRPALLERYRNFDDYYAQLKAAAEKLVAERYLLTEDVPRILKLGEQHRPLFE